LARTPVVDTEYNLPQAGNTNPAPVSSEEPPKQLAENAVATVNRKTSPVALILALIVAIATIVRLKLKKKSTPPSF
jgi:hypothetical protein